MILTSALVLAAFGVASASQWPVMDGLLGDALSVDAHTYVSRPLLSDYGVRIKRVNWCDHTVKSATLVSLSGTRVLTSGPWEGPTRATSTWARGIYSSTSSRAGASLT